MKKVFTCARCQRKFTNYESHGHTRKFCSLSCRNDSYVGGRSPRAIERVEGHIVLTTARGDRILISEEDEELSVYSWAYSGSWHGAPRGRVNRRFTSLHRLVYERATGKPIPYGLVIDHINRDPLDNRRANLRSARPMDNSANRGATPKTTSRYKGVYRLTGKTGWIAAIRRTGTTIWIGTFKDEREAAYMYDQYALAFDREFACCNVVHE